MLVKRQKRLEMIDPQSWEHPADKAALVALKQLNGFDILLKNLVSVTTERSLYLMHLASDAKVTDTQYPIVNHIVNEMVEVFDWPYKPTIFITQSPFFNAQTIGVNEPFIVLNSNLLNSLSDAELKVVIAHELGHIMSGHVLYKTLVWLLSNVSLQLIPMASVLIIPIKIALAEWDKKSELTADRAALLGTQEEMPNFNVLMRIAGGNDLTQVNINDFFLQAKEFYDKKTLLDSVHKLLNDMWANHPMPIVRLQELKMWSSSGSFTTILDGNYIRRSANGKSAQEDIYEGYKYYKDTINNSDDPLSQFASNISSGIDKMTENIADYFKQREK